MRTKRALICGVSGQDGAYLARLLLSKGYEVIGTSRDAQVTSFSNLRRLGVYDRVQLESVALNDFRSVLQVVARTEPEEIYNLAGQTSVALSFDQPVETLESISFGTLNLLEAIRFTGLDTRLYNAGSGESFGDTGDSCADEESPFRPRSPYAVAKAAAFWEVANYRDAYGLYACSGIMFNHESPLRSNRFVTQKVVSAASRIAAGSDERLRLGDISVVRDWGWAPEYVEAMWGMLQCEAPRDLVIATGASHSLAEFVSAAFGAVELDWRDHVHVDPGLIRPAEICAAHANPTRAREVLGWAARYHMHDVVRMMVAASAELMEVGGSAARLGWRRGSTRLASLSRGSE